MMIIIIIFIVVVVVVVIMMVIIRNTMSLLSSSTLAATLLASISSSATCWARRLTMIRMMITVMTTMTIDGFDDDYDGYDDDYDKLLGQSSDHDRDDLDCGDDENEDADNNP